MFMWKLGKCRISLEAFLSMFSMGTSFGTTFRTTFPDIHYLLMIRKIPVFAGDTQYFNSFKTFPSMISYWYLHKIYQIWLKSCLKTTCFGDGGPFSKNFSIYHLITIHIYIYIQSWNGFVTWFWRLMTQVCHPVRWGGQGLLELWMGRRWSPCPLVVATMEWWWCLRSKVFGTISVECHAHAWPFMPMTRG